jgi:hypothetical protein
MCWDIVLTVSIVSGLGSLAALGIAVWHHLRLERGSHRCRRP